MIRFGWYPPITNMDVRDVVRYATIAEESGFDSVWISDHTCRIAYSTEKDVSPDPWIVATTIAMNTHKIRVGPCVTDPVRRHPLVTAQIVSTLDYLSRGRVNLGLGRGSSSILKPIGLKQASLRRLREAIEVMKILWTNEVVDYKGEFYTLDNFLCGISSAVVQKPHPPIYIGALSGRKNREYTGEVASGYLPFLCPSRLYRRWIRDVEKGAKKTGRSPHEIDTCALVMTSLSEDYSLAEKCAEIVKKMAMKHTFLFKELGYTFPHDPEEVPSDLVKELVAIGSAEDCIKKIEEYIEAGAKHILIRDLGPDLQATFRVLKEKIIPYFSDAAIYNEILS